MGVNNPGGGTVSPPLGLTNGVDQVALTLTEFGSPQTNKMFKIVQGNAVEVFSVGPDGTTLLGQGAGTGSLTMAGTLDINTAGRGISIKEGSNAKQGLTAAMSAGVVTTANTAVTANSRILYCQQSGTLTGFVTCTRTAGTSFTLTSSVNTDTAVFAYEIFEPG